jgi:hypothetical protein
MFVEVMQMGEDALRSDCNPEPTPMNAIDRASSADLFALLPRIAEAAGKVHADWAQDEDGHDEELGTGGICDLVASEIASIVSELPGALVATQYNETDTHTSAIAALADGVFVVDIPARVYEIGYGYVWKKIVDADIGPQHVEIVQLSKDPASLHEFVDDLEPDDEPGFSSP